MAERTPSHLHDGDVLRFRTMEADDSRAVYIFVDTLNQGTLFDRPPSAFCNATKQHRLFELQNASRDDSLLGPSSFRTTRWMRKTDCAKANSAGYMTDTCGHPVALCAHAANIQDRDAAVGVFQGLRRDAPEPRHVSADCGDRGPKPRLTLIPAGRWTIRIVRRCDTAEGFGVLPRRRVVEPAFAGLGRCRRLARDREKTIESAEAQGLIAHIRRMTGCLARA